MIRIQYAFAAGSSLWYDAATATTDDFARVILAALSKANPAVVWRVQPSNSN